MSLLLALLKEVGCPEGTSSEARVARVASVGSGVGSLCSLAHVGWSLVAYVYQEGDGAQAASARVKAQCTPIQV